MKKKKVNKSYGYTGKNYKCRYPGCSEIGAWRKGEKINKRLCLPHYLELVPTAFEHTNKDKLRNSGFTKKCMVCGWDKTLCDIHRIVSKKNGGKYEAGNVISLCPNCHRMLHRKKLVIDSSMLEEIWKYKEIGLIG